MQDPDFFDEDSRWMPPGNQDNNYGDSGAFGTTAASPSKFTEYYEACSVPKSSCNRVEKLATKPDCNQFGLNRSCQS